MSPKKTLRRKKSTTGGLATSQSIPQRVPEKGHACFYPWPVHSITTSSGCPFWDFSIRSLADLCPFPVARTHILLQDWVRKSSEGGGHQILRVSSTSFGHPAALPSCTHKPRRKVHPLGLLPLEANQAQCVWYPSTYRSGHCWRCAVWHSRTAASGSSPGVKPPGAW